MAKSDSENLWNTKDPVKFAEKRLGISLDQWQRDYINTDGNVAVRAGRQSGKSFAQALRSALYSLLNANTQTLIIGAVDRQSVELFEKVKSHIINLAKFQIKGKPTMHKVELKNGSKIIALPAGRTGYGLRNYTIHKLIADEAHYIGEEVWVAVRPMLATTGGTMDLLSTPRGNLGFFYEAFQSEDFTTYHTTSEQCARISDEFLKGERKRMSKLQYAQEYLAEFLDALQAFFPEEVIQPCITYDMKPQGKYYLGVDIARYGGDENAFVIADIGKKAKIAHIETTTKVSTQDTIRKIQDLNRQFNFKKIYIDDGGIGGAVLDYLLEDNLIKRKIQGLNNASRSIDNDGRGKKILKENLYDNARRLFEQKLIEIPDHEDLIRSLKSIQYEYNEETGRIRIHGRYTHITEALIRAVWAIKTKGLNMWIVCK